MQIDENSPSGPRPEGTKAFTPCTLQGVAYNLLRDVGAPEDSDPGNAMDYTLGEQATKVFDKLSGPCGEDPSLLTDEELQTLYHDPAMRISRSVAERTDLKGMPVFDSHAGAHDEKQRVGVVTRSWVENNEIRIEARIDDPKTAALVRAGTYGALSLGVESLRDKPGMSRIARRSFKEVSVCAQPFFEGCKITMRAHKSQAPARSIAELLERRRLDPQRLEKARAKPAQTKTSNYKPVPFLLRATASGSKPLEPPASPRPIMSEQAPPPAQQQAPAQTPAPQQQQQQQQQAPNKRQQRDYANQLAAEKRKNKESAKLLAEQTKRIAAFEAQDEARTAKYAEDQQDRLSKFTKALAASQKVDSVDELHEHVKQACEVLFTNPDSKNTADAMWGLIEERNEHIAAAETFEKQMSAMQERNDELTSERDAGNRAPATSFDDVFEADEAANDGGVSYNFEESDDPDAFDATEPMDDDMDEPMDEPMEEAPPAPAPRARSRAPAARRSPYARPKAPASAPKPARKRPRPRASTASGFGTPMQQQQPWRADRQGGGRAITMQAAKRMRRTIDRLPDTHTDAKNSAQLAWLLQGPEVSLNQKLNQNLAGRTLDTKQ